MITELAARDCFRFSLPVSRRYYEILRRDLPLVLISALYMATAALLARLIDVQPHFHLVSYPSRVVKALLVTVLVCFTAAIIVMAIRREPSPIGRTISVVGAWVKNLPEMFGLFLTFTTFVFFISTFSSIKSMIPLIRPFELDPLFAEIDRILHAGVAPWHITHAVFSGATATALINLFYNLWFFVLWGMFFFFMLRIDSPRERLHYLLAQLITWSLLGSAAAVFLSSAGPCYYGNVVAGDNPFAPLMELLTTQNEALVSSGSPVTVLALNTQNMLWELYVSAKTTLGSGISAMPSMHVASTVVMALGAMRISRLMGICGWIFVAIIQVGSVHLGWHYAIDGYFSILAALLLWKLAGKIAVWWLTAHHIARLHPNTTSPVLP